MRHHTRWGRHALIVLALWLLGSLAPHGAEAQRGRQDGEGWIELQSQHFTLFSEVSPRRTRRIALGLEGLRAMLGQLTGLELDNRVPTRIYIFGGERSFEPYKFLYQGRPADVAGYFVSREQANYIALDAENVNQARAVVYHEYVHEVLDNNFRDLPVWFNEGLAEYYSTFEIEGDVAAVGKPVVEHWQWLNQHEPLPIDVLLAVGRDSPIYNEGTRRGSFYAQSWALVHYLLVGNEERQGQVVEFLRQRRIATSQEEAFQNAFGGDYGVLERELLRYLRRLDFPYLRLPVPEPVSGHTESRPLPASEALVLLGDLLANQIDLRSEAEDHYRRALAQAPGDPQALAGLGYLAERRLDLETALDFYRQAHQRAPDDPLLLYRLAKLLLPKGGTAADQARALLRRCIVLDPDFAPAWAHLSYAVTFLDPLPEDAVGIGQAAFQLYPARWDVALNLLNHYTRLGHREVAESMVDGYFRDLDQGAHLPQARELMIQMDLREAHAAAEGDVAAAVSRLDALEARWGEHLDAFTRRQVLELRSMLGGRRDTDRYNEAVLEINAGRVENGRRLLEALILDSPDGPVADGARRLLRRLVQELD